MEEEKWDQAIVSLRQIEKLLRERIQAESKSETFNRGVLRNDGCRDISKRNI